MIVPSKLPIKLRVFNQHEFNISSTDDDNNDDNKALMITKNKDLGR